VAQFENHVWSLEELVGLLDCENASTRGMMNKSTTSRVYGIFLATPFSIAITFAICRLWPGIQTPLVLLIFIGLWVGCFITGVWIMNRSLPISGAERRRRNKQFYDWLRSQGRR
jgi:hypothetical protein